MPMLKGIDFKILAELINNSKISDRKLARNIGVSQPTVTRRRANLEREIIDTYTAIPKWGKLGFKIMALTFIKGRDRLIKPEEVEKSRKVSEDWFSKEANVVFAAAGTGMSWQGVIISYHKNFSTLASLERRIRVDLSEYIGDTATFAIDLNPGIIAKKFNFKYLSELE
ncbi:MAG: Lrp/AsnC family transcriptional regulator [Candidatus Bathyarchaeota archaeon]|nr:Lrp/AsnC family transcriptional regulator [Candidatus Bathyarchaeota archaeon]